MIPPKTKIPASTDPRWTGLIKGTTIHEFKWAAASMLVFNLRTQLRNDPARLSSLVEEARKFFIKYEQVLANDIKRLFG